MNTIEELQERIKELEQENLGWRLKLNVKGYQKQISDLESALKEAQKNADRYQWLKGSSGKEWDTEYFEAFMEGRLDGAIDENMQRTERMQAEENNPSLYA